MAILKAEATAAPQSPHPMNTIINQSRKILAIADTTLHHMASLGLPSRRMTNSSNAAHTPNNSPGIKPSIYSRTNGSKASEEPSILAIAEGNNITGTVIAKITIVANIHAWVTLMRAALNLCCAIWMDATTEHPAPIISPSPVTTISIGTHIFMAAIPSAPTACPTNIPSMAVIADMLSIPNNVGRK